jgi:geranylgeranyl pyrophosphate synthase
LQGHVGQALDLGLPISKVPREQVAGVVEASVRLKTGALTGLAFAAGAILGGVEEDRIETAYSLGEEIGVVLQFLDDLKNLKVDPLAANKQYEDLQNQRPSLVWMIAAEDSDERCWSELVGAVEELPDQRPVKQWILDHRIIPLALHRIEERMQQLRSRFARPSDIAGILQQLVNAYEQI